jgi:pantoate--beta-alanine ligase
MIVCTTPAEMQEWSRSQTADGRRVAVVPTMGALHDGHMALVEEARRHAEAVVVTIFVNPLQFDRPDDLAAYPRPIDDDLALCEARGVDAVYAPLAATMYPEGFQTGVTPGHLGELLEGAHRPGHFRGVTTVVTKLFHATRPDVAVFGEKDFQQLAILRRMTSDLDFGIEVVGLPTVREADGLAMSSRNRRLTPEQRSAAVVVPRMLDAVAAVTEHRPVTTADLVAIATEVAAAEPLARFEHLDVVDAETLEHLTVVDGSRPAVALTAVWFGEVRLIDNRRL